MPRGRKSRAPKEDLDEPEVKKAVATGEDCSKYVWYPSQVQSQSQSPAKSVPKSVPKSAATTSKSRTGDISQGCSDETTAGVRTNEKTTKDEAEEGERMRMKTMMTELIKEEHTALGRELGSKLDYRLLKLQQDLQASFQQLMTAARQDMDREISRHMDSYQERVMTAAALRFGWSQQPGVISGSGSGSGSAMDTVETQPQEPAKKQRKGAGSKRVSKPPPATTTATTVSSPKTACSQLQSMGSPEAEARGFSFTVGPSINIPPDSLLEGVSQLSVATAGARRKSTRAGGAATSSSTAGNLLDDPLGCRDSDSITVTRKGSITSSSSSKNDPLRNRDLTVILSGLPETECYSQDLYWTVDKLVQSLGQDVAEAVKILKVQRITRQQQEIDDARPGEPGLVKVALEDLSQKALVLRSKYKLAKSADFSQVEIRAPSKKEI